jgi:urease accessory protein UreF
MESVYKALGIHKLKLLVSQLKAANSLAVGSQARKNVLTDLEVRINEEETKRITQEDSDKLFAIKLLLDVLKAKEIPDVTEQMAAYKEYLGTTFRNSRFANTDTKPAPTTIKVAKQVIDAALSDLLKIILEKKRTSPEAEAARARRKAQDAADIDRLAEEAFLEAQTAVGRTASQRTGAEMANALAARLETLRRGGRRTRKGRKGRKSKGKSKTRKH